jgi:hypothetical protein
VDCRFLKEENADPDECSRRNGILNDFVGKLNNFENLIKQELLNHWGFQT